MNIGLDIRMLNHSGIGRTIRGLLSNLTEEQLGQLALFGGPEVAPEDIGRVHSVPYPVYSVGQHWKYPKILNQFNLSFFHMPHFDVPLNYKRPFIATVHDLIHVLYPQFSTRPLAKLYAQVLLRHVAKNARRIFVVSENTKRDLAAFFPEAKPKIRVVYPAAGEEFKPTYFPEAKPILAHHRLEPGYFLYVGNLRPSKNTPGLIKAYLDFKRQNPTGPDLVLAGKNFLKNFTGRGFPKGIRHIDHVQENELPALYSQASVFIFPSFYEGFGLPPLEAMACGAPCIVSDVASLPEVCGDAAEFVNPHNEIELPRRMEYLWKDSTRQKELKRKGLENVQRFSWRTYAQDTWKTYEELNQELLSRT